MIDETSGHKKPDDVPTKIFHANKTISAFHGGQVHTVDGYQAARHQNTIQLIDEKRKMLLKFSIILAVAHVPVTIRVGVQTGKWRRKNRIVDGAVWNTLENLHTVTLVNGKSLTNTLI